MGGACSHNKASHSPHQREFCTEGLLSRYALGILADPAYTYIYNTHTLLFTCMIFDGSTLSLVHESRKIWLSFSFGIREHLPSRMREISL